MKSLAILFSIALLSLSSRAAEIVFQNTHGVVFSNSVVSTNFVATGAITNVQPTPFTTYHTFQGFYTVLGTNAIASSNVVDSTIDGTNWISEATNSWTTNGSFQYTLTGKRAAIRNRTYFVTTNANLTLNYIAQ